MKSYLNLGPDRPLWALIADALLAQNILAMERNVDLRVRVNPFLQSWKPAKSAKAGVCKDLWVLLHTASKFGLRPDGLIVSKDLLRQRPIWLHGKASQKICYLNNGTSLCLKNKHQLMMVGEAEEHACLLDDMDHRPSDECECRSCNSLEVLVSCMSPYNCTVRAKELLDTLPPKWDSRVPTLKDMGPTFPEQDQPEEELGPRTGLNSGVR